MTVFTPVWLSILVTFFVCLMTMFSPEWLSVWLSWWLSLSVSWLCSYLNDCLFDCPCNFLCLPHDCSCGSIFVFQREFLRRFLHIFIHLRIAHRLRFQIQARHNGIKKFLSTLALKYLKRITNSEHIFNFKSPLGSLTGKYGSHLDFVGMESCHHLSQIPICEKEWKLTRARSVNRAEHTSQRLFQIKQARVRVSNQGIFGTSSPADRPQWILISNSTAWN